MTREFWVSLSILIVGLSVLTAAILSLQATTADPSSSPLAGVSESSPENPNRLPPTDLTGENTARTSDAALSKNPAERNSTADNFNEARPHFELSSRCALCHSFSDLASAMRDSQRDNVAPVDLWQSSMMAQSARDPYWRAVVSAEVLATPQAKPHIEELCTRCHAPMAAPVSPSPAGQVLSFLRADNRQAHLGLDGVSCTVCHQINADNLGLAESFTGNFVLNTESKIFGPHANPTTMPMQRNVGFTPTHSPHILQSALCATCHTVITDAVDAAGEHAASQFHEQAPYLEWRNSTFNNEVAPNQPQGKSCQACHMPVTDPHDQTIKTKLAHNPGGRDFPFLKDREPYGRHTLVGGNALMTRILRDNAAALGVSVPRAEFDRSLTEISKFLGEQTAQIELGVLARDDQQLTISVTIKNLCGHKFPTAYPSRRAWIELQVVDAQGNSIFHSGRNNEQGILVDSLGQPLPSELAGGPVLPHLDRITSADQVQIYESIMSDADGQLTFLLVRGAAFSKDNRLLPAGWQPDYVDASSIQPHGLNGDANFTGGSDQVTYVVPVAAATPVRVKATLHYQVISARHAAELFTANTAEVRSFQTMYEAADRRPETVASASVAVD